MWQLYQRTNQQRANPADEIGLPSDEKWLRWMFNNAVFTLGRWVENKLAERDRDGKPVHRIERLLDIPIQPKKLTLAQFKAMGLEED